MATSMDWGSVLGLGGQFASESLTGPISWKFDGVFSEATTSRRNINKYIYLLIYSE